MSDGIYIETKKELPNMRITYKYQDPHDLDLRVLKSLEELPKESLIRRFAEMMPAHSWERGFNIKIQDTGTGSSYSINVEP